MNLFRTKLARLPLFCLLLLACGGEVAPSPSPDAGAVVVPVDLRPVTTVSASNDLADAVRVTWEAPSASVSGYRVLREGVEVGRVAAGVTSYEDKAAPAASLLAPKAEASQGNDRAGIKVTWTPTATSGVPAVSTYTVVAVYGAEEARPSEGKKGSRTGVVTGYEVTRGDGKVFKLGLEARELLDVDAPRAKAVFGAPMAEGHAPTSTVRLSFMALPTLTPPASASYRVRALAGATVGASSPSVTGVRGAGIANEVDIQWQRSSDTTPTGFTDLPGVTGLSWYDRTAPTTVRHFRARTASDWVEPAASASATASATRWKQVESAGLSQTFCGITHENRLMCWAYKYTYIEPTTTKYDRLVGAQGKMACARRMVDHTVDCWGPTAGAPAQLVLSTPVAQLAAGPTAVCGLRESDGSIVCSDYLGAPLSGPTSSEAYSSVSVGEANVCGVRTRDGGIDCFLLSNAPPWGKPLSFPGGPFASVIMYAYSSTELLCAIESATSLLRCSDPVAPRFDPATPVREARFVGYRLQGIRKSDGVVVYPGGELSRSGTVYQGLSGVNNRIEDSSCALAPDGRIRCWRLGGYMGVEAVDELEGSYTATVGSHISACGIRKADGQLECTGSVAFFRDLPGDRHVKIAGWVNRFVAIEASTGRLRWVAANAAYAVAQALPVGAYTDTTDFCAIRASDGHPVCWESPLDSTAPPVPMGALASVRPLEWRSACGVRTRDNKVQCWGLPGVIAEPIPDTVEMKLALASGDSTGYVCAIRAADHRVVCYPRDSSSGPGPREPFPDQVRDFGFDSSDISMASYAIRRDDHTVLYVDWDGTRYSSTERFATWSARDACGLRENDGKFVCVWGDVPIR